jgi:hypothetical protein
MILLSQFFELERSWQEDGSVIFPSKTLFVLAMLDTLSLMKIAPRDIVCICVGLPMPK